MSLSSPDTQILAKKAVVVDSIPVDEKSIPEPQDLTPFTYMHDVKIHPIPHRQVDVIMGVDLAYTWCLPKEFRQGAGLSSAAKHLPGAVGQREAGF